MAGARDRLVHDAAEFVRERGFADVSLRELAGALGTSHRMLIYHFGSKEALYVEVIRTFEAEQRAIIAAFLRDADAPAPVLLRRVWRQVSAPRNVSQVRMFFLVCGAAVGAPPESTAASLLGGIVSDWVEPIAAIEHQRSGGSLAEIRADVRAGVALMRGLLLDLLATGDRRGVNRAFERFAATYRAPVPAPGTAGHTRTASTVGA